MNKGIYLFGRTPGTLTHTTVHRTALRHIRKREQNKDSFMVFDESLGKLKSKMKGKEWFCPDICEYRSVHEEELEEARRYMKRLKTVAR